MKNLCCCRNCLNWDNGSCFLTDKKVREDDYCPQFEEEEISYSQKERKPKIKKKNRFQ